MEKKLVIFLGSMGRGGAERVISILSDYFCKKGWEVWICLLLYNKVDYIIDSRVHIIDLTSKNTNRIFSFPKWFFGVRKVIRDIKPKVVLSFAARINIIVLLAVTGLKQNVVISERNDPYMDGRSFIIDYMTKLLYPHAKAIIFQTKRALGYFKKFRLKNVYILPNPIYISKKKNTPVRHRIISVGRLTNQKNHKMLIKSFRYIQNEFKDAELYIYGEGELRAELEELVKSYNLQEKVYMPGNILDIHSEMAKADVFVLTSNYEGLSNALLEALSMGLPCIATNVSGVEEYIENGVNGLIVDKENVIELNSAIEYIFKNPGISQSIGKKAKERAKILSKDTVCDRWYKIINNK